MVFSRLGVLVGSVEGRTMLEVNGRVGVSSDGTDVLRTGSVVMEGFVGFSQAVCTSVNIGWVIPWR